MRPRDGTHTKTKCGFELLFTRIVVVVVVVFCFSFGGETARREGESGRLIGVRAGKKTAEQ